MKNKIFAILVTCILLVGCCPCKKLGTNVETKTEYVEIIKERIVKDTVEIVLEKEIYKNVTKDSTSHLETKYAISDAEIKGGLLYHSLENKSFPIRKEIEYIVKDTTIYETKEVVVEKIVEVEKKVVPFWCYLTILTMGALLILYIKK